MVELVEARQKVDCGSTRLGCSVVMIDMYIVARPAPHNEKNEKPKAHHRPFPFRAALLGLEPETLSECRLVEPEAISLVFPAI